MTKTKRSRPSSSLTQVPQPVTVQEVLVTMRTIRQSDLLTMGALHHGERFAGLCDELLPYVSTEHRLHVATRIADHLLGDRNAAWRDKLPMVRLGMTLTEKVRENMSGWLPGRDLIEPERKPRKRSRS